MTRQQLNLAIGVAPIVMSVEALAAVIFAVATGWQTNLPDEGAGARIFQFLIFTQPVLVLIFLVTADWARWRSVAGLLGLQALGVAVALGTLWYFESNGL